MNKEARAYCLRQRKIAAIEWAEKWGNVSRACRTFRVSRSGFYRWKKRYDEHGEDGLKRRKPIAKDHPRRIPETTVQKVLELRRSYHLGPQRIVWYMDRYHDTRISFASVYRILVRNGVNRLPKHVGRRAVHTRRYQYTAIDDATRIRALQIYERHTQANAIRFFDYMLEKFPFRIHTIRTDRGHEWQALFHWHVEDKGIRHVYIKPRSPQLNGKVERSHRTDQEEFYQLLTYTGDVDLSKKLAAWEDFYNLHRPHGAHAGQSPYEALKRLLVNSESVSA